MRRWFYGGLEKPQRMYRRIINEECCRAVDILDLGCGYAAPDLQIVGSDRHTKVGVDVVDRFEPVAAPSVRFVRGDVERLPFADRSFDLVISKSVLEHLEHPQPVFDEVSRVLRADGRFIFLTPNWLDYVSLFASVIPNRWHPQIVRFLTGREEGDTFPTHYRVNTRGRIEHVCRRAGLQVDTLMLLRADPHYLKKTALTYLVGIAYEQTTQRFLPQLRPWILGVCSPESRAC